MARSSGGGSRSGGSRSSSSGSRSSSRSSSYSSRSSRGIRTSTAHFPGARKFRYYRNGTPHYIYSSTYLPDLKDPKPRWFAIVFYIPFICAIIGMFSSMITIPQKPLDTYNPKNVALVDAADVFTDEEELLVGEKLKEFCDTTGVTTQIITVNVEEWKDNAYLEDYALAKYHTTFRNEDSWLIVYSEEDEGNGEWYWEGIQGDNTFKVMDVFIDDFNTYFHSKLLVEQTADPASAFIDAFNVSIEDFNNQRLMISAEEIMIPIFITGFICFHAYFMIFAGTRKKYKYSELEEVVDGDINHSFNNVNTTDLNDSNAGYVYNQSKAQLNPDANQDTKITCKYCGYQFDKTSDGRCPNCNALDL